MPLDQCPECGAPTHDGPCTYRIELDALDWRQEGSPLEDLRAAAERAARESREVYPPPLLDPGFARLVAEFAAANGLTPPPGIAPPSAADDAPLVAALMREMGFEPAPDPERPRPGPDSPLQWSIDAGLMSLGQARDVDAFVDGILERRRTGELTEEQADELVHRQAVSDALALVRARTRNRAERRAAARAARARRRGQK